MAMARQEQYRVIPEIPPGHRPGRSTPGGVNGLFINHNQPFKFGQAGTTNYRGLARSAR
jgi:hypothetical protein